MSHLPLKNIYHVSLAVRKGKGYLIRFLEFFSQMQLFLWKTRNSSQIGESNGNPLQYSCLENPMYGGAWQAAVHGVARSWIRLSDFTFTFHFHALEKEMATHSSILAWRIPEMAETGGLPSMRLHSRTRLKRLSSSSIQLQEIMCIKLWKIMKHYRIQRIFHSIKKMYSNLVDVSFQASHILLDNIVV